MPPNQAHQLKRAFSSALCLAAVAAVVAAGPAAPDGVLDHETECPTTWVPNTGLGGVVAPDGQLTLDVLVLLDGPTRANAARLLASAADAYRPLAVELNVAEWGTLWPVDADGVPITDRDDPDHVVPETFHDRARHQLGGGVPAQFDAVYVLTDVDLARDGNTGVAGSAACVGGIIDPFLAFAVGEVSEPFDLIATTVYRDATAKIFAHEIGHLMGGSHTFHECGRQAVNETEQGGFGPCSLMSNAIDLQGMEIGAVNGGVIRNLAETYLDPRE